MPLGARFAFTGTRFPFTSTPSPVRQLAGIAAEPSSGGAREPGPAVVAGTTDRLPLGGEVASFIGRGDRAEHEAAFLHASLSILHASLSPATPGAEKGGSLPQSVTRLRSHRSECARSDACRTGRPDGCLPAGVGAVHPCPVGSPSRSDRTSAQRERPPRACAGRRSTPRRSRPGAQRPRPRRASATGSTGRASGPQPGDR